MRAVEAFHQIWLLCFIGIRTEKVNLKFNILIEKITLEHDLSIVEDEIFMGFHSSIKNFNERVKLIDKSIDHSILK